MENKKDIPFPEAGATAFFGYKRTDGFEVSLTLRDETGQNLLEKLEGAIAKVKKEGGIPLPLRSSGFVKPINYIEGRVCPKNGARLVAGQGKIKEKCENYKWGFNEKKNIGTCDYLVWNDQSPETKGRDMAENPDYS